MKSIKPIWELLMVPLATWLYVPASHLWLVWIVFISLTSMGLTVYGFLLFNICSFLFYYFQTSLFSVSPNSKCISRVSSFWMIRHNIFEVKGPVEFTHYNFLILQMRRMSYREGKEIACHNLTGFVLDSSSSEYRFSQLPEYNLNQRLELRHISKQFVSTPYDSVLVFYSMKQIATNIVF